MRSDAETEVARRCCSPSSLGRRATVGGFEDLETVLAIIVVAAVGFEKEVEVAVAVAVAVRGSRRGCRG